MTEASEPTPMVEVPVGVLTELRDEISRLTQERDEAREGERTLHDLLASAIEEREAARSRVRELEGAIHEYREQYEEWFPGEVLPPEDARRVLFELVPRTSLNPPEEPPPTDVEPSVGVWADSILAALNPPEEPGTESWYVAQRDPAVTQTCRRCGKTYPDGFVHADDECKPAPAFARWFLDALEGGG